VSTAIKDGLKERGAAFWRWNRASVIGDVYKQYRVTFNSVRDSYAAVHSIGLGIEY